MHAPALDRPAIARTLGIAVIGVAFVAALSVAGGGRGTVAAAASPAGTAEHSISVHGTGRITIKPDTATFSVGIDAQANKAKAAMDQASARMTAIIAALKAGGVADADRQTSQISLSPTYDYNNGNRPVLTGYTANQTLTVKVRAIDKAGDLIDAAVEAGANNVGGISFSVDDPAAAMDQARTAAVADAKHRAGALAQAAGITLGAPISIVENGGTPPSPIFYAPQAAGAGDKGTPVDPGTTEVTIDVDIMFAIA